ncbi:MAG: VIT domain-containing protein [Gilvibacter sp.]
MRNFTLLVALIANFAVVSAQSVPVIQVGEKTLGVKKINVDVQVLGNVATTTYDMYFYNPTDQILEGELNFPLGEGQKVVRYALEVNGKLREAVVVEKEKGRIAFEAVVRRRVDPALLEQVTGNNYKSRIYPIPAKGYKRVVIGFEQTMLYTNKAHELTIQNSFDNTMEHYGFSISVPFNGVAPTLLKDNDPCNFSSVHGQLVFNDTIVNAKVDHTYSLQIPKGDASEAYLFDDKAYLYKTFDRIAKPKAAVSKVAILWDASLSMKDRDIDKELSVLAQYLEDFEVGNSLELVVFSNQVIQKKKFVNNRAGKAAIKEYLENLNYDGATSFDWMQQYTFDGDEVLLFSDGINTHSDFPACFGSRMYVISAAPTANFDAIKQLAACTGGDYINLSKMTVSQAVLKLTTEAFYFTGAFTGASELSSYPAKNTLVNNDFGLALEGIAPGANVVLYFGTKTAPRLTQVIATLPLKPSGSQAAEKRWANLKIDALLLKGEDTKNEVISLAKQYGIITPHTSLIVLETAQDYADYQIEPPADLKKEYDRLVAQNTQSVFDDNQEVVDVEPLGTPQDKSVARTGPIGQEVTVTGTVTDNVGSPLPGVNIIVAGTARGTQTDFDGNYAIDSAIGEVLVFSYVGFDTLETDVAGNGSLNLSMREGDELDEVIVTAQGIKRESKALGYAVSEVGADEIANKSEGDVARVLSGKASGVAITNQSGMSGSSTNVIIRGYNSITGSNQALIIVDGVPFSNDTNSNGSFLSGNNGGSRLNDLDPNVIADVRVLKGLAATTLYGSAGRNGVIVVTTKSQATGSVASASAVSNVDSRPIGDAKAISLSRARTYVQSRKMPDYMVVIKTRKTVEDMYDLYLQLRPENIGNPAFFIDVFDVIYPKNQVLATRILSNLGELDLDNYELLKALGYKYEAVKNYKDASFVYKRIVELRPEDAQSYRDLALVYAKLGKKSEAQALVANLVDGVFYNDTNRRRFSGLDQVLSTELQGAFRDDGLETAGHDLRVVIDWNHNDTDIDLYIYDPNFEECYYSQPSTSMGGKMSSDMTQGFGPEQFVLPNAKKGMYYLSLDYFGDRYQKIENPTYLKVTIFKNYGRANQTEEVQVIHLDSAADEALIAKIKI